MQTSVGSIYLTRPDVLLRLEGLVALMIECSAYMDGARQFRPVSRVFGLKFPGSFGYTHIQSAASIAGKT